MRPSSGRLDGEGGKGKKGRVGLVLSYPPRLGDNCIRDCSSSSHYLHMQMRPTEKEGNKGGKMGGRQGAEPGAHV